MTRDATSEGPQNAPLFIAKGMTLSIPAGAFTITIGDDGVPRGEIKTVHLRMNMCPTWSEIACNHVFSADALHQEVLDAAAAENSERLAKAIEREAAAGMQAVVACCTAIDAFYALLKEHVTIDAATLESWRDNRLARHTRIAEVIRRAVRLTQDNFRVLQAILKESFRIRDQAVHPSAKMAAPAVYQAIHRATELRLVLFRFENARTITSKVLGTVVLVTMAEPATSDAGLRDLLTSTRTIIGPLVEYWESRYGAVIERLPARREPQPARAP